MKTLKQKLGLKDQKKILALNIPEELKDTIKQFGLEIDSKAKKEKYDFILVFSYKAKEAEKLIFDAIKSVADNSHFWFCYPKGTSKKYKSEINRDSSWKLFAVHELEPVSQVAIDEDWSALRFRRTEEIKKMTRKTASAKKRKERIE